MLKAMIEKIEKMAGPKVFDIGNEHYASDHLVRIYPEKDFPKTIKLTGLDSVSKESKVSSNDNGVSQTVEARTGVALTTNVEVRPYVNLQPFRTFLEVPQPESNFLLRLDNNGHIALIEADGGVWKLEAARNIARYFEDKLVELIGTGRVVVLR